jgi:hypothetical protein
MDSVITLYHQVTFRLRVHSLELNVGSLDYRVYRWMEKTHIPRDYIS